MEKFQDYTFIFIGVLVCLFSNVGATCYSVESCLYDSLMANYNNQVRPATAPGSSVDLTITAAIFNILTLDERNEVLQSVMSFDVGWFDSYLSWNISEYGINEILIDANKLWLPDIAVVNSVEKFYQTTFFDDFRGHISNTGEIEWQFGGIFKTSCSIDITNYPFDSQSCSIEVQNWSYKEIFVNITQGFFVTGGYNVNSLWRLVSTEVKRSTVPAGDTEYSLPRMSFTLHLKRKTDYYLINILMPIILLSLSTLGVFILPPDCGEKISLGITVLLAFSVFQIVIMDITPVNSEETPYISKIVTCFMVMSTLSLLSSMLSVHVYFKKATTRVPKWLRIVAFKGLAKVFFLQHAVPFEEQKLVPCDQLEDNNIVVELQDIGERPPQKYSKNSEISELIKEVKFITSYLKGEQKDGFIMDEWKLLAILIDRVLLVVAIIVIVATIIAIH